MMELKRCPFCGGEAHIFASEGVTVYCEDCGASTKILVDVKNLDGRPAGCATEKVIELWNTRAE